ncbi:PREDICTED: transmembrane 9 superfamily member 1-like [Branchiostoma belcheri]|uniref:Transmembrane 9 superfamily member n=1 Tax=Branchiostoma belcheri TaxID=7741 RepID=A0A6P4ZK53_BRABE|nr:PREDICTED: transmembrane 9 superfamily member 1-like [Branchiostoma belcheri]
MAALLATLLLLGASSTLGKTYEDGEKVTLYVNKVGPYFNPHETYNYYELPLCRPEKVEFASLTLGEVLHGDRMAVSTYEMKFKEAKESAELCKLTLKEDDIEQLKEAIEDLYYFEFVLDELPIRGFIGHLDEGGFLPHKHKVSLWTHHHFNLEYNGNQIISANVTTRGHDPLSLDEVEAPLELTFTYSVMWKETTEKYETRGQRLRDSSFFPKTLEIHWLSIINSMVLVFLLIGFVVIILMRVLKNDFARYNTEEEDSEDLDQDDNGWKIIHTDVFRFPPHKSIFCAILGVGSQFLALATGIIVMALMGMFNVHKHGAMNSAAILLYALTSCVSGYVSGNMFRKLGGHNWVWNIILVSCIYTVPFFLMWSVANSVAWYLGSTQALPYTTVILLMLIWLLVGFPLTVIGGIFGKNMADSFDAPCRTKNIPREIPPVPWYRSAPAHMLIGGFLPFSAISVELYYIFATMWGREQYTLYGILFIVFVILLSVTGCISVALTYFQLSSEDYRWWWRSIFSAGSTGVFIFLYALFYYYKRSNMSGTLQTVEFFGYTILICYAFFLSLGTVSFFASLKFIRYIYVNLKMD